VTFENSVSALEQLLLQIERAIVTKEIAELEDSLRRFVEVCHRNLSSSSHATVRELCDALQSRNLAQYAAAYEVVEALDIDRPKIERLNELFEHIKELDASLASDLENDPANPAWDQQLQEFDRAVAYIRTNRWLEERTMVNAEQKAEAKLKRCKEEIEETTSKLVASQAWAHFFSKLQESQRRSLNAWSLAVKKIGKGTGKHAEKYRKDAREELAKCRSAIPAWILPIHRIFDTVEPVPNAFDVVIIDEASQSGPEALLLFYLAKKVVVVGDDKQISPESVGVSREDVFALQEKYLQEIPQRNVLGLEDSLFDLATVRFGSRVQLREHFRCMPEIIRFSNNLCYQSEPLIPLRQFGADRLPPIQHVWVDGGYREGGDSRVVNPPEAEAIVRQIQACCEDPAYDGKSFGVISLQGEAQARLIEHLLLNTIGPEEYQRRQLVCGDAYAFQGDERDVIFLSLVAAVSEEKRIGVLSKASDERRFNVAASRARDQMWLFHSATQNDLSSSCLRRRLLEYMLDHEKSKPEIVGVDVEQLEQIAKNTKRELKNQPKPFDSWFEIDVCLDIARRGYRVIPQFEVNKYHIDLVVEGLHGRLAVECDGDAHHGPEKYEQDAKRQRDLERCGWRFWRVRGSTYYRSPSKALESLWPLLEDLNKAPEQKESSPHFNAAGRNSDGENQTSWNANRKSTQGQPLAYKEWKKRHLVHPDNLTFEQLVDVLLDIVRAEGPVLVSRVYRLYADACGMETLPQNARTQCSTALQGAVEAGLLLEANEYETKNFQDRVIRVAGDPSVVVRKRGNRLFGEIPPSEFAAVMKQALEANPTHSDAELLDAVLLFYGLTRVESMTPLEVALKLVGRSIR
jgi:very-short-patch-repair endonuclease